MVQRRPAPPPPQWGLAFSLASYGSPPVACGDGVSGMCMHVGRYMCVCVRVGVYVCMSLCIEQSPYPCGGNTGHGTIYIYDIYGCIYIYIKIYIYIYRYRYINIYMCIYIYRYI